MANKLFPMGEVEEITLDGSGKFQGAIPTLLFRTMMVIILIGQRA